MKSEFSKAWKASKQPRKQRKYKANAPLHIKGRMMSSKLSKELAKKHSKKRIEVKKGDKVIVMRGQFKKKTGNIERANRKNSKVYITGIETIKKDGSKALYPINTSNIMITELNTDDKRRIKKNS
jgi:large subunit ribosomal protein L24